MAAVYQTAQFGSGWRERQLLFDNSSSPPEVASRRGVEVLPSCSIALQLLHRAMQPKRNTALAGTLAARFTYSPASAVEPALPRN
jgi:hypothetical protein